MDMTHKILHSYTNGNTKVTIYEDGTKVREFENIPEINHPESIDVKITNYCDMGCEFCLHPDSLIKIPNGAKPISEISKNDQVYALEEKSGNIHINTVENVIISEYLGDLIELTLEDGTTLNLTPNHKVYTQNRGWIVAEKLTMNDNLLKY